MANTRVSLIDVLHDGDLRFDRVGADFIQSRHRHFRNFTPLHAGLDERALGIDMREAAEPEPGA